MQKEADRTLTSLTAKLSEEEMSHTQREKTEAFSASKAQPAQKKKNRTGKCFSCGSTDHFKRDCPKIKKGPAHKKEKQNQSVKNKQDASAWTAETGTEALLSSSTETWVVDCEATHHMTPRQDWFETMKPYSAKIKVANGSFAMAKGCGTVRLKLLFKGKWTEKLLTNVLWVPELSRSLFSSGAAADRGCETFTREIE